LYLTGPKIEVSLEMHLECPLKALAGKRLPNICAAFGITNLISAALFLKVLSMREIKFSLLQLIAIPAQFREPPASIELSRRKSEGTISKRSDLRK
jgi:hypothetical protein